MNPAERKFRNDFCPYLKNKWINVEGIIHLMRFAQLPMASLPEEVRRAVCDELQWRKLQESLR